MCKIQRAWKNAGYYELAEKGSTDRTHPGMVALFAYAKSAKKILDFGCGEGTRLSLIKGEGKKLYGIDISKKAISIARKKYPDIKFVSCEIQDLKETDFDLIFSAFVLEHTRNMEEILKELISKLCRGGILLLIAPNYGAPNRASPVAKYGRLGKMISGFLTDMFRTLFKNNQLSWREVEPIKYQPYRMDFDTTIEPYIRTLSDFLINKNMMVIMSDSVWTRELENVKPHQKVIRFLGERGIYPFKFWGPHLVVAARKK